MERDPYTIQIQSTIKKAIDLIDSWEETVNVGALRDLVNKEWQIIKRYNNDANYGANWNTFRGDIERALIAHGCYFELDGGEPTP
ncbi:MAG: hypothetical protein U0795_19765 [Pirellulales bacterium]